MCWKQKGSHMKRLSYKKIISVFLSLMMLAGNTQVHAEELPPEETTPEATTPEVTTPEVTTPEVTTPEVTTQEVTTPEVTTPSTTKAPNTTVPDTTKAPDTTTADNNENKPKMSVWGIIIALGAAAVIAIVTVMLLPKKNRK